MVDGETNNQTSTSSTSTSTEKPSNPSATNTLSAETVYKPYNGNMGEYCQQLENWLNRAYWQRECAVSAYYTALNVMYPWNRGGMQNPNTFQNTGNTGDGNINQNPPGINNNNNFAEPNLNMPNPMIRRFLVRGIRTNQNTLAFDFVVAPLWKRLFAECIDFLILLVVKLFVTLTIIENFNFIDFDSVDLDELQQSGSLVNLAITLSWELFILELTHRIVVCFFEAYCLARGGATPGKSFMHLRVLHCDQVIPISAEMYQNNNVNVQLFPGDVPSTRVLVSPGSFLSFQRAFVRSAIKNFSLAIFFPFCFTLFHYQHNRTMYDHAAKSIVVEIRQD